MDTGTYKSLSLKFNQLKHNSIMLSNLMMSYEN